MDNCIENLLCDFLGENAILSGTSPCFSWSIRSDRPVCRQEAYFIEIFADSGAKLWNSGWIDSSDTVIHCRDLPLVEMMCGYWRVSVRLDSKTVVKSSPSVFYTGIPCGSWIGKWIAGDERKSESVPVSEAYNGRSLPYFWKGVVIDKPLSKAYLYITSLGIYEFYINGVRGHRSYYAPGWTDYSQTIHYQVYDVTEHFLAGENTLCVILGDGWYRGYIDFRSEHYGNGPLCLLAQLVLEFADGTKRIISTDESWRTSFGAFRYGDLQMGEYYDALKAPSFCRKQIDSTFGDPAVVIDRPGLFSLLKPQSAPLPEPVAVLEAKRVHRTNRNSFVFDLGQNISGVVRLRIKAKKGSCIKICYGEMLEEDGTVYTKNLRTAAATDFYIAAGTEVEEYQPHFTTHGFQYAEVWGIDEADVSSLRGIAICAACAPAGTFSCSDERINKLYSNIVWGQRGNFHSIPTDCPQRDERLGWTGDVQVFCKSACYNMDCDAYFRKYLFDMEEAQQPNGAYTDIAPVLRQDNGQIVLGSANAAWGDAGVIVAWNLYLYYADKDLLKRHYPSMKRHVDYLLSDGFDRQNRDSYGDWLNIDDAIPKQVMCLAYMAYDTLLMSKMAGVLDYNEDQRRYATEYGQLKNDFLADYTDENGVILGDTQTGYLLALRFGLYTAREKEAFVRHLVRKFREREYHLSTGFVGVSHILPVLSENRRSALAYRILSEETYPSWLYSVKNGATTIWERWNSYTEDGFGDDAMNSFNHYSLGSVCEWLFSGCCGIMPMEEHPGFEKFLLAPHPAENLQYAAAVYRSVRGTIQSSWELADGGIRYRFVIPANTTAVVRMPQKAVSFTSGPEQEDPSGVSVFSLKSGTYEFFVSDGWPPALI